MDIQKLKHLFLNREQREGYENELVLLFGIKFGLEIAETSALLNLSFIDTALIVTQDKQYAKLIETGYRLYEYVIPR